MQYSNYEASIVTFAHIVLNATWSIFKGSFFFWEQLSARFFEDFSELEGTGDDSKGFGKELEQKVNDIKIMMEDKNGWIRNSQICVILVNTALHLMTNKKAEWFVGYGNVETNQREMG